MIPLFAVAILLGIAWYAFIYSAPEIDVPDNEETWDRAGLNANPLDTMLLRASQPLRANPTIYEQSMSPTYKALQARLLASGGKYAGSVEVFLTVQVVALVVAMVMLALAMMAPDLMSKATFGIVAAVIAMWPSQQVKIAAKKRTEEINNTLPSFADLLQMPLSAGMGVLPAISFTVERIHEGVVHDEITNMLNLQKSRSVTDAQAFMMCGERLGTPEAKSFFTALMQAHTQGMRVVQNIEKQAEALREKAYEQRREIIMRLPAKISIAVATHFMPAVLIITMFPVGVALTNL